MTRLPTGSLVVAVAKDGSPHWEGKWRHQGRQIKRRIGPAHLVQANRPGHTAVTANRPGQTLEANRPTALEPRNPTANRQEGSEAKGAANRRTLSESASVRANRPGQTNWQKAPGRPPEGVLDRTDALIALRSLIASHAAQEAEKRVPAVPTFEQVAEAWFERAKRRQCKPATLLAYRWLITAHIKGERTFTSTAIRQPCPFVSKLVTEITKQDMREWFDPIPHSPQKANLFKAVKSMCRFAVEEGWISDNPARHVDCRPTPDDGSYDYFTADEIDTLLAAARDAYDACLYATAAYSGLRKGELFALQWGDIDFEHSRIVVRRNYSGREIVTPKNGRTRVVPLVSQLGTRLKAFHNCGLVTIGNQMAPTKSGSRLAPTSNRGRALDFVFPGSSDAAMARYRKTLKRAGLRRLPFHSLRHSFGSHAVQVATLVQVRDWLGHSDLRMTARYLHAKSLASDSDLLSRAFE